MIDLKKLKYPIGKFEALSTITKNTLENWINDIAPNINMIESVHYRWIVLLKILNEEQLARTYNHLDYGKTYRIDENTGLYAWHCNHHLSHIKQAKQQNNWS